MYDWFIPCTCYYIFYIYIQYLLTFLYKIVIIVKIALFNIYYVQRLYIFITTKNYLNWLSHSNSVGTTILSLTKPSIISRVCTSMVKTISIFFLSLFVSVAVPISVTTSSNWVLSCCKYYIHEKKISFYSDMTNYIHNLQVLRLSLRVYSPGISCRKHSLLLRSTISDWLRESSFLETRVSTVFSVFAPMFITVALLLLLHKIVKIIIIYKKEKILISLVIL